MSGELFEVMKREMEHQREFVRQWFRDARRSQVKRHGRMSKWMLAELRSILRASGRLRDV